MLTNQTIEQVLSGRIHMDDFLKKLQDDQHLQEYLRSLIPPEAKNDPAHSFWKVYPYETMQRNNFDFYRYLFCTLHHHDRFGDNLNLFSGLQRVYQYHFPDVQCTGRYREEFGVYLDAIQDCFDGPEVQTFVQHIIDDSLQIPTKTKRKKYAQMTIKANFHVENRKRPRWIQGPEWPMGSNSPMAFVTQKEVGECVNYEFRDVDTGEARVVKQFY